MNRQDKIQKLHNKRLKRARAKLKTSSKERYISKADRAKNESQNYMAKRIYLPKMSTFFLLKETGYCVLTELSVIT